MRPGVSGPALGLVGVVVLACLVSGCEPEGIDVGALNQCGEEIEADVVSRESLADVDPVWSPIAPDERADVRSVAHDVSSVYLIVRRPGTKSQTHQTVPLSKLAEPPDGANYDKEAVLTGKLCPR